VKRPFGAGINSAIEGQADLVRSPDVEMIPNHALKPHPACLWPVEYTGLGNLKLAERQIVYVACSMIGPVEWRWQSISPSPKEAFHYTCPKPVTDLLQLDWVFAGPKPIVERLVTDISLLKLSLCPFVSV
jgi:hypothetical protein